jgi:hypothetical protein
MVGEPTIRPEKKEEKKSAAPTVLIHTIAQWYHALMQREIDELGVSWSGLRKGFVSRAIPKAGARPAILLKAERWCDITELKALCTLVRPPLPLPTFCSHPSA